MSTCTVEIDEHTLQSLRELSQRSGESIPALLDKAVAELRRRRLLEETNTAYAGLRADPKAWQEELDERSLWDATLMDDIDES